MIMSWTDASSCRHLLVVPRRECPPRWSTYRQGARQRSTRHRRRHGSEHDSSSLLRYLGRKPIFNLSLSQRLRKLRYPRLCDLCSERVRVAYNFDTHGQLRLVCSPFKHCRIKLTHLVLFSYHGGKYTFLRWAGVSSANYGAAFYTNPTVVANFQNYVKG